MMTPVGNIVGDCEEDTELLVELAGMARNYITSFSWCLPITAMYLAYGIGGVIAIFLIEFDGKIGGTDDRLWVVVGDLPPAYMVVVPGDTVAGALEGYCLLMDEWVDAVLGSGDFHNVYPVAAPKTAEYAEMLRSRLEFIRKNIIPEAPTDLIGDKNTIVAAT
jgi:hypothetical protein